MLTQPITSLLVLKVGETTSPAGLLAGNVTAVAAQYAGLDKAVAALGPGFSLESLYTERDLILIAMGACRAGVQVRTRTQDIYAQQEAARLQTMYATVQAEIVRVEQLARQARPALVGQITAVNPELPPFPGGIDASNVGLRGDPYFPNPGSLSGTGLIIDGLGIG